MSVRTFSLTALRPQSSGNISHIFPRSIVTSYKAYNFLFSMSPSAPLHTYIQWKGKKGGEAFEKRLSGKLHIQSALQAAASTRVDLRAGESGKLFAISIKWKGDGSDGLSKISIWFAVWFASSSGYVSLNKAANIISGKTSTDFFRFPQKTELSMRVWGYVLK